MSGGQKKKIWGGLLIFASVVPPLAPAAEAQVQLAPIDVVSAAAPSASQAGPSPLAPSLVPDPAFVLETEKFDKARSDIYAPVGANAYKIDRQAIEATPQGDNTPFNKVLLQAPGVTQDSAASGGLHVRNEHANVQYRINGILLPDGVSGFGQVLETSFVQSLSLITGVLPAQYGLRTAGLVDVLTRSGVSAPGGLVGVYGGAQATFSPYMEYGGAIGRTQFFMTGRYFSNDMGVENPTASYDAIHDLTRQGKYFGYVSTILDDATRVSFISGMAINKYQIPNSPGQPPQFTAYGHDNFNSSLLNENQLEQTFYNVLAVQRSVDNLDAQLAFFSRISNLHFTPDPIGDLVFNGVASDVARESFVNGLQGDAAARLGPHTLRFGFLASAEKSDASDSNVVLPLDALGNPIDAPFNITQAVQKVGWLGSLYASDEWRIADRLTLNAGLRFDQMVQYVNANQLSPRISLVYHPIQGGTLHAGFARYFTPPPQSLAAPVSVAPYANTTLQPEVTLNSAARPERSSYIDAGYAQKILPGLEAAVDAYYKRAKNLLDDGQFGQALVLTAFNYDRAYNTGVEFTLNFQNENFRAYANFAWARQRATSPSSNQYLFGADEYAYISSHYVYTDHAQTLTGSGGVSYLWNGTRISADLIYGSGLRSGFANTEHVSPYAQVNLGVSHEFPIQEVGVGPLTLRFDVINLFDRVYEVRDGSGIGVFAPQYGPLRGFYVGIAQKF
ncbi:TonB-dependent receptor [Methylocapsa acidiphila]|uniref:TonB-dependent receptor n=1 Tax=Methylocapsa acidiphila TaxID=133552 RepID=UPI0004086B71|nr:TonB-dependent receptor [Methylocapsa acidiphila]